MSPMAEDPVHLRMSEMRHECGKEMLSRRENASLGTSSFRHSLPSIRSSAELTLADREKLFKLKDDFNCLEAELREAFSAKAAKDSKSATIAEVLSTTISRSEQLKKTITELRRKKDEYGSTISKQLVDLKAQEEKSNHDMLERKKIEEAIEWYSRFLGFRVECGEGVKFIFDKIDVKNPDDEHSFSIRLENDAYKLLDCKPYLEGILELIQVLNKTNSLFKFARIMREKFQDAAALNGMLPATMFAFPDPSSVTVSSAPPISVDSKTETTVTPNDIHVQDSDCQFNPAKKINNSQPAKPSPSPLPALHSEIARRSPRLLDFGSSLWHYFHASSGLARRGC
ncbi:kinetochore protein SPC25 homolog isoform X2 [Zingiber officinale]|uniref:kinetochore protein SPC25 homolog isoform X2 n=1 Tax=Zingiber officinale TaxID=94328 RepID=UPI001C4D3144|nr:kinetochore protein SPC25 homolog isoform X2 [Zingiber officinale]